MPNLPLRRRLLIETLESREVPSATPDLMADINPGAGDSSPSGFVETTNGVFFTTTIAGNTELYVSTGSNLNATLTKQINLSGSSNATLPVRIGNNVVFGAFDGTQSELYLSSGTGANTSRLKDINTSSGTASSNPRNFITQTASGTDTVFFTADDGTNGEELWKTDGTAAGTLLVKNLTTGAGATTFGQFFVVNDKTYFLAKASSATNWSVYSINTGGTDATAIAGGTVPGTFTIKGFTVAGTDVFFTADNGSNDYRLFRVNSTTNTLSSPFTTAVPSFQGSSPLAVMNGAVYFSTTPSGGSTGQEPSKMVISTSAVSLVKDINQTASSVPSFPQNFVTINNEVYFAADDGVNGVELWRTDGTTEGTILTDIRVGANSSSPSLLTNSNGQLVFTADNGTGGTQLFQYDTVNRAGPTKLTTASTSFGAFTVLAQRLFLAIGDATNGIEPYLFDPVPDAPLITGYSPDQGLTGFPATFSDRISRPSSLASQFTFTGKANGAQSIQLFDSDGVTTLGSAVTAAADGSWTITGISLNGDGVRNIKAKATDNAGTSPIGSPFTLTIDGTAPTIPVGAGITAGTDTGSSNSDGITKNTTPVITGTADPGSYVNIYVGGTLSLVNGTPIVVDGSGNWSYTLPAQSDGLKKFDFQGLDSVNNQTFPDGSVQLQITIDTAAPAPGILGSFTPDTGTLGDRITNATVLTLTGTAEGGVSVNVFDNGVSIGTTTTPAGAGSQTWNFTTPTLAEGAHSLTFQTTDAAGNVSIQGTPRIITIDTTAPGTPSISSVITTDTGVSATDGNTSDNTITLTGTFNGTPATGDSVSVYNGATFLGTATLGTGLNAAWTFTTSALTDGNYSFKATAEDLAANASAPTAVVPVTVDTLAPATPGYTGFSTDSGAAGDGLTNDRTLTISGTGENGTIISLREGAVAAGSTTVAGGVWSITTASLADGPHNFTATATDLAGNVSATPLTVPTITIDATAPLAPNVDSFVGVSPPGFVTFGTTTSATVITLSGSSGEAGLSIALFDGATLLTTLTSDSAGLWSFTTATLTTGAHAFKAIATDAAGNVSVDSPILTVTVDPSIQLDTSFPEDSGSKTFKGSDLLAGRTVGDSPGALTGVAITSLPAIGAWSYSTNGKTFLPVLPASISATNALLLRSTDSLRFTPAANFTGIVPVSFRAWDQTGGLPGTFANASVNGLATPFSVNVVTYRLAITNTNDRPSLPTNYTPLFPSQSAGVSNPAGTSVGSLLAGNFSDPDALSKPGIGVVGATGAGAWQFKRPQDAGWTNLGKVSAARTIPLDAFSLVRFVPTDGSFIGAASLVFKAWDGSSGVAGTPISSAVGTAFGLLTETATLNVGNTPPSYLATNFVIPAINEDTVSAAGVVASKLFLGNFVDNDAKSIPGIAITGVDESFGNWQFSTTGSVWQSLTGASPTRVLLLKGTQKIRFVPNANLSGAATINFNVWDGSAGVAGNWTDPTGNNAFGSVPDTSSITVLPVNDRPVLVTTGTPMLPSTDVAGAPNTGATVASLLGTNLTDIETVQGSLGIAVTALKGNGTWEFNRGSGWNPIGVVSASSALILAPADLVRFTPKAGAVAQLASISYKGWDTSFGTPGLKSSTATNLAFSTAIETAYVSAGNTAPSLSNLTPALPALAEDPAANPGFVIKTQLGSTITLGSGTIVGKGAGLAITAVDNTNGVWQYALASTFKNIPVSVSNTNALLLPDTAKLKFVPNLNYNGSPANSLSYKAWDRTVGVAGEFADTTRADVNAFGTTTGTPTLTITPVNDRPVVAGSSTVVLTPIALNNAAPAGDLVSSLVPPALVSDAADGTTTFGIAVTGLTGAGTWQYNDGTGFKAIVAPTVAKALLLDPTWTIRFVATNPAIAGTASITYRAWDISANVAGTTTNAALATNTSLSLNALTATVSVGNTAPTI